MKVVVRRRHVVPVALIVALFATIQNLMEFRRPPLAVGIGLGIGAAAGLLTWVAARSADRKRLRGDG